MFERGLEVAGRGITAASRKSVFGAGCLRPAVQLTSLSRAG